MTSQVFTESNLQVEKESLYEVIASRIEHMILENQLHPGDRLPSEPELARTFGVSRNVMREALKALKERELIVQRNGDGTYVAKPDSKNVTDVLNRIVKLNNISYSDIFEMRLILEPQACAKFSGTATQEQLRVLEEDIQDMVDSESDYTARATFDLNFHRHIIEYAGNPLLTCVYEAVTDLSMPILEKGLRLEHSGHMNGIIWHRRIVEAIRQKTPAAVVESFMREHLETSMVLCAK